ncbi:C3a anaphylatoxin chemotactic receptor-like [Chiloscyllium plagiosum]|uniref:C3a anaphylatoxin chemotactic receptor-like n=1 Tax=Chiloscyllium plagiosum TaxID=36176 RepID=UPI001CB7EF69|nr:C3a anaphylatoxin chemotactic receptor-like [Chiloscyllium plagiosum]
MDVTNSTTAAVALHQAVICVAFTLIFLIGLLGNGMVIWIILCTMKQRFPTVILILNLAVADFSVLITLPFWIYSYGDRWVFGASFCTGLLYLVHSTMFASVFFIMVMSIERLVAVLYPFTAQKCWRHGLVRNAIIMVWAISFLLAVPVLTERRAAQAETPHCSQLQDSSQQQEGLLLFETLVGFAIPFLTLSVCNALVAKRIDRMTFQGKSKSVNVTIRVTIAFAVCWLPYHIRNLFIISSALSKSSSPEASKMLLQLAEKIENLVGALAVSNSCINPILYAFAARRIQNNFMISGIAKLFQQLHNSSANKYAKESTSRRANSQQSSC